MKERKFDPLKAGSGWESDVSSRRGSLSVETLLHIVLVCSVAFSLWSSFEIKRLKSEIAQTRLEFGRARIGDFVPKIQKRTVLDSKQSISAVPGGGSHYLYFFSPACPVCQASAPYAEKIYESVKLRGGEMYGVSFMGPSETRTYLRKYRSSIPTISITDHSSIGQLRIRTVPAFAKVNSAGRIEYIHYGALTEANLPQSRRPN